ncbi:MAG: ABC transporter permease, partial [Gemmatimonadaceae bacterium]
MTLPPFLDGVARDLRVAVRGLLRAPTFAITAVLVLGLGIGMTTAVFTVFRSVLVQKLPVRDQDRIVVMSGMQGSVERDVGRGEILRFAPEARTLSGISSVAHQGAYAFALMDADRSVVMNQSQVSGNFFAVLGARPALGRLLRPEDDVKGAAPVMVISYGAWKREFGGDSSAIGHELTMPVIGWHYRIVGVAPPGLDYPAGTDYWVPIAPLGTGSIISVARLAPGATVAAARTEFLNGIRSLEPVSPITGVDARTFPQEVLGNVRPVLVALTAAVVMLLLIACVNVGNLLLLRATTRARELAVRRALGARFADVVRQLLVESALIGAVGGAVGLLLGDTLLQALIALAPSELPRMDVIQLAGAPVWAACGVTLAAVLLFGVVPALAAAAGDPAKSLRLDGRSGGEASRGRLRQSLVVSQIALAVVMLSGAGLLARTVGRLQRLDLGFSPDHVSILTLTFPFLNERYDSEAKIEQLLDRIRLRMRSVPGVVAITPVLIPPFVGDNVWLAQFATEGQSAVDTADTPLTAEAVGDAEYFKTFRMPILRGRGFAGTDRAGGPLEVVVSESVARRLWPGQDPIGKRLRTRGGDGFFVGGSSWRTVVGVVADPHYRRLRTPTPMIIAPANQWYWQGTLAVRTLGTVGGVVPGLERAIAASDPDVKIWRAQPMAEIIAAQNAQATLAALLLSAFGAAALVLAAIGLY